VLYFTGEALEDDDEDDEVSVAVPLTTGSLSSSDKSFENHLVRLGQHLSYDACL